jgi:RNA polymerase sigma-70 factor, ECF subfamily
MVSRVGPGRAAGTIPVNHRPAVIVMEVKSHGDDREEILLAQVAQRVAPDPGADVEAAFREHHAGVLRAAHRITGNTADAEDVLQTVFLRLMRLPDREAVSNLGGYLHRAAVHAAIDLLRSRQDEHPLEEAAPQLRSPEALSPERRAGADELRAIVREEIARLPARSAEMLVLRYLEGHENREIARAFSTSRFVVAVTLHRARARLEKQLRSRLRGKR